MTWYRRLALQLLLKLPEEPQEARAVVREFTALVDCLFGPETDGSGRVVDLKTRR